MSATLPVSPHALLALDPSGRVVASNPAARRLFGATANDLDGAPLERWLSAPQLLDGLRDLSTDDTGGLDATWLQPDGSTRSVKLRRLAESGDAGTLVVQVDATQPAAAHERELARMAGLYDALDQLNHAVVVERTRDGLFQRCCRALVEHGGFRMAWIGCLTPGSTRIVPVAQAGDDGGYLQRIEIHVDDRPQGRGPTGTAYRERRIVVADDLLADPRLESWWPQLERHGFRASAAIPIHHEGAVEGVLNVYADTAGFFQARERALLQAAADDVAFALANMEVDRRRREAEEALRQLNEQLEQKVAARTADLEAARARAEAADRVKSTFLATMSHELRTPLNSILGFTGIILRGLAGPLTEEQAKQLTMVKGSARHLLDLINDVLDISRIEAGQLEIRAAPFDLRESIERVVGSVGPLAAKKGLALRTQLAPGLGVRIGDRRRVEQVLLNLVNNAIKFTEHGAVEVEASPLDGDGFGKHLGRPRVRLVVRDTGVGIPAEALPLLFQPFRQVDSGAQRQHEGTGLGLAICRRLVTLMGGSIDAESTPGSGSIFTVILPLAHQG